MNLEICHKTRYAVFRVMDEFALPLHSFARCARSVLVDTTQV